MKLPITIEYNSGESATYIAQPPEWAKWEKQTGHTLSKAQEVIGIWDLMFLATTRTNARQPASQLSLLTFGWKQSQMFQRGYLTQKPPARKHPQNSSRVGNPDWHPNAILG